VVLEWDLYFLQVLKLRMTRLPKQLWFNELQEMSQILQVENSRLKKLLNVAEEDNQRLQEQLQSMKVKIRESSMNETMIIPFFDHGKFTSYGFEHDSANACTLCQASEDDIKTSKTQGGFLEALSTDPSHQEQLDKSQEADQ
jgi:hypothetical protein